jgi:type IV secretion system protein VirB11
MPNLHQDKSNDPVKASAKIKLERDLGPEILAAFADPKTIEIMLNSDGKSDNPLNQALLR